MPTPSTFVMAMKRSTTSTDPLNDTVVTYRWDEAELAQVEAHSNGLPPHDSNGAGADAAGMGHNRPPDSIDDLIDDIEQDEQIAALIVAYVATETINSAMALEDVAQLDGAARLLHNRNGLFLATIRYCRQGKRPDMTLALANVVHGLADNRRGTCFISFGRLARLLCCTTRTLRRARERAEELGLLLVIAPDDDSDDDTNLLWLAVMPELANV